MTVQRFSQTIIDRRWLVMLASVAWILLLAYGGKFLSFSADTRVFFSRDNPHLLALESLENIYSKTDYLAFVVAPKDGDVFTRESLTAIEKMTEASWQIPYSSRVSSMTNHQHIEADGDDLLVSSLVEDASSLTDTDIERIRHITLGSPRLIGRLVSGKRCYQLYRYRVSQQTKQ